MTLTPSDAHRCFALGELVSMLSAAQWHRVDAYWELRVQVQGCTPAVLITVEPRPYHCNRGRFIARADITHRFVSPSVEQHGFPRYYMRLECAQLELREWITSLVVRQITSP